jgi:hypothetical protein
MNTSNDMTNITIALWIRRLTVKENIETSTKMSHRVAYRHPRNGLSACQPFAMCAISHPGQPMARCKNRFLYCDLKPNA